MSVQDAVSKEPKKKLNRSIIIAATAAVIATGWVLSGVLFSSSNGDSDQAAQIAVQTPSTVDDSRIGDAETSLQVGSTKANADDESETTVRTRVLNATAYNPTLVARGQTEANRIVTVRAETSGRIMEVGAREGSSVGQDDLLVQLELGDREARRTKARALVNQRAIEYKATAKLQSRGFAAETKKAEGEALLAEARAELRQIQVEIEDTTISAPFVGVLEDRAVEIGDFVQEGDPIATLVDLNPVLVTATVNERNRDRVDIGQIGTATLINGTSHTGRIRFVSAQADSVTRTFRIELEIANPTSEIPAGMTAEITLDGDAIMAHRISPALLSLDDDGILGVKIVDAGIVRFKPITVIADTPDGVWIGGLQTPVRVITVGQDFVADGQHVRPVDEDQIDSSDNETPATALEAGAAKPDSDQVADATPEGATPEGATQ
ncbi:MAG: efflux RND transporter periplasmic adaptor subunit [Pseudomonadota bacterium]